MRLSAACLTFFWFVLSASHASGGIFNPKTATLENGLQVVVIENHRAPIVTHMVWYKVGATDDPPGKSGLAHFLEHLMFKGTSKVGPGEFSRVVAENGGRENAFTSQDYTGYYQTISPDRLGLMMEYEADRMTGLVLTDELVAPERQVVLEERRSRVDNSPGAKLREQADAAFWLNHPYGVPIIGWEHEIAALTTEDAIAFYRKWYGPQNAILVVAGDVDSEEVLNLARKYYGVIPGQAPMVRKRPAEPAHIAEMTVSLADPRVTRTSISRRYLAPGSFAGETRHAQPLELLAEILSGGATSRLHKALVVDQGIATSAGAWYDGDGMDLGSFSLYISPKEGIDAGPAEDALKAQIDLLLRDGVTGDELARAKQRLTDGAVFARDSVTGPAQIFGQLLSVGGSVDVVETWPEKVEAVTVEQVNEAARFVLSSPGFLRSVLKPGKEAS